MNNIQPSKFAIYLPFIAPTIGIILAGMALYYVCAIREYKQYEPPASLAPKSQIIHVIGGIVVSTTRVTIKGQCFLYVTRSTDNIINDQQIINIQQLDCNIP